ncbi:PARP-domain-containing protein [Annulohypoxylon bovei var. microspora]|nr:PARP-domain-containing protein [Annulohypoxylon bovei var. microspora]
MSAMSSTKQSSMGPTLLPLTGCIISMSGSLPGRRTQAAVERDYINTLGASLSKEVTPQTTHLVSGEAYYRNNYPKVRQAKTCGIPIVTFHWLEDSRKSMTRMDEEEYLFEPSSTTGNSQKAQEVVNKNDNANNDHDNDDNGDNDDMQTHAKRGRSTEDEAEKRKVHIGEAQIAKSRNAAIPLDEGAQVELPGYEVYIDEDGVIFDASLNLASNTNNMNKFYRLQLLRCLSNKFYCRTRWGRVGDRGTTMVLGNGTLISALREFNGKFQAKTGLSWTNRADPSRPKKYIFIERSYEPEEEAEAPKKTDMPQSHLARPVQELMKLIFNRQYFAATMADLNYNANTLPLGKLSKSTIMRGYEALTNLSALLNDPSLCYSRYNCPYSTATEELSNLYFSLIPHVFGRNKPPIIEDLASLQREIELLESLSDMKDASLLMAGDNERIHVMDQQFQSLGLDEMSVLDSTSQEFIELKDLLLKTQGATHQLRYEISEIFRISRRGEKDRLEASYSSPRDRRLLWHGSRCTNFGGILSQGLRIAPPEAPVSGYSMSSMFGKGVYLADTSSKSANYCRSDTSNGHALLLLCEAELGNPMQLANCMTPLAAETAKDSGLLSTWGQGQMGPTSWKDAGCIHPSLKGTIVPDTQGLVPTSLPSDLIYNEYICYDVAQEICRARQWDEHEEANTPLLVGLEPAMLDHVIRRGMYLSSKIPEGTLWGEGGEQTLKILGRLQ